MIGQTRTAVQRGGTWRHTSPASDRRSVNETGPERLGRDAAPATASVQLLLALARHGVRFVLFGTGGAWAHGARLPIGDIDICPDPDPRNLERLGVCLDDLGGRPVAGDGALPDAAWRPDPPTLENFGHRFETALGWLDVVPYPYGPGGPDDRLAFAELNARASTRVFAGQPVRIAGVDDLLASKRRSGQPKDRATVRELLRVVAQESAVHDRDA